MTWSFDFISSNNNIEIIFSELGKTVSLTRLETRRVLVILYAFCLFREETGDFIKNSPGPRGTARLK
jgi:hypothetical protein